MKWTVTLALGLVVMPAAWAEVGVIENGQVFNPNQLSLQELPAPGQVPAGQWQRQGQNQWQAQGRRPHFGGSQSERPGGPGGPGGGPGRERLSPEQEQAFHTCMQSSGVPKPERPAGPTDVQRAAVDACRTSSQSPEAFKQCAQNAGVAPPTRPNLSSTQMQALMSCRQQAMATAQ